MSEKDFLIETAGRQVLTTRLINAPVDAVYKAWTDPAQLALWWGPNGFTNTFHIFDLQPGGRWSFVMHGPNGVGNYDNESVFIEIDPLKKLVLDHVNFPLFRLFATFTAIGNQTHIEWIMAFNNMDDYNKVIKIVPEKNEENLDRLEALLASG